jgi:16S rRNA (uracil1498-N3)-methyltransferase
VNWLGVFMHKFFTEPYNITNTEGKILGDDVKHIYKVLRLSEGEEIVLNNCEGIEYLGKIRSITKSEVIVDIIKKLDVNNESGVKVYLFQGLPKGQKMDLIVQKGTELGIVEFIPTITARVDVKLKGEFKKLDRLNRIALEASKQSKRSIIPKVKEVIDFEEALNQLKKMDLAIVPYENAEDFGVKSLIKQLSKSNMDLKNINNVGILIGPEGGFEEEEISSLKGQGAYIVTLGNRILRTETAGFTATALIQYELGDLGGMLL